MFEWLCIFVSLITISVQQPINPNHQDTIPLAPLHTISPFWQFLVIGIIFFIGGVGFYLPRKSKVLQWSYLVICSSLSFLVALIIYQDFWNLLLVGRCLGFLLLAVSIRSYIILSSKLGTFYFILNYLLLDFFMVYVVLNNLAQSISQTNLSLLISLVGYPACLFGTAYITFWAMVKSMVTERKSQRDLAQAYEKLKHYSQLIEGQAILRERNYIAREVHDAVGHYLTAQSIQLENVAAFLSKNPPQAQYHLEKSRELLNLALNDIHEVVFSLSHLPFSNSSFAHEFNQLLQDFSRSNSIDLVNNINLDLSLPTEVAITIYRLTQEALTNVIKHSQAQAVTINLFSTMGDINKENDIDYIKNMVQNLVSDSPQESCRKDLSIKAQITADLPQNKLEDIQHQSTMPANFWESVTDLADQNQSSSPKLPNLINTLTTPVLSMVDQPSMEPIHGEYISLVIADNGIGFRLADQKTGFGLRSMHERTAALGGILQIVSDSPQGCVIISRIPKYWHN